MLLNLKAFSAENKKLNDEMESLAIRLSCQIKTEMNSSLLFSEQLLQKATMSYDQVRAKIFEEKDKVGKDIFYVLEELINFKTFVESSSS